MKLTVSHFISFFAGGILVLLCYPVERDRLRDLEATVNSTFAINYANTIVEKVTTLRAIREPDSEFSRQAVNVYIESLKNHLGTIDSMLASDNWAVSSDGTMVLETSDHTYSRSLLEDARKKARAELLNW